MMDNFIHVGFCEACDAMGEPSRVEVVLIGNELDLLIPDRCAEVHPEMAPPFWQYRILRSRDGGVSWEKLWRGWPVGSVLLEIVQIEIYSDLCREAHEKMFPAMSRKGR